MSTPSKAASNAASTTDLAALQADANARFIADANVLIDEATAQGKFFVYMTSFQYVDLEYINTYFFNLGYRVSFPDANLTHGQPAELFGEFWDQFWQHNGVPPHLKNPTRVGLNWR